VSGATEAHGHLEPPFETNDDWERDNRDTVADSGGVLQPPQGIPENVPGTKAHGAAIRRPLQRGRVHRRFDVLVDTRVAFTENLVRKRGLEPPRVLPH